MRQTDDYSSERTSKISESRESDYYTDDGGNNSNKKWHNDQDFPDDNFEFDRRNSHFDRRGSHFDRSPTNGVSKLLEITQKVNHANKLNMIKKLPSEQMPNVSCTELQDEDLS